MNDNFETKSRSGNESEAGKSMKSSMSGNSTTGYSSRRIKRENKYIQEKEEYLKQVVRVFFYAQYTNLISGICAVIWLSLWEVIPFAALGIYAFKMKDSEVMDKMRYYGYIVLAAGQIVFTLIFLLDQFVVCLLVNIAQITIMKMLKDNMDVLNEYVTKFGS